MLIQWKTNKQQEKDLIVCGGKSVSSGSLGLISEIFPELLTSRYILR